MREIRVPALLTCVGGHLARYSVDILCFAGVFVFIVHDESPFLHSHIHSSSCQ